MTAQPLSPDHPQVRVVRGDPTDAELAALVTGLMAFGAQPPTAGWPRPSGWADHSRSLRPEAPHGPDAWRWSLRP